MHFNTALIIKGVMKSRHSEETKANFFFKSVDCKGDFGLFHANFFLLLYNCETGLAFLYHISLNITNLNNL